ncbi:hypothetical protein lerEdw1_019065 [Lerista edwardsae]|nr:hypothetical protein lerEdw1_019065 [Lerista edwardsae]
MRKRSEPVAFEHERFASSASAAAAAASSSSSPQLDKGFTLRPSPRPPGSARSAADSGMTRAFGSLCNLMFRSICEQDYSEEMNDI